MGMVVGGVSTVAMWMVVASSNTSSLDALTDAQLMVSSLFGCNNVDGVDYLVEVVKEIVEMYGSDMNSMVFVTVASGWRVDFFCAFYYLLNVTSLQKLDDHIDVYIMNFSRT